LAEGDLIVAIGEQTIDDGASLLDVMHMARRLPNNTPALISFKRPI